MIPMLRVFSSVNLRGIDQSPVSGGEGRAGGKKNGPLGPTRAAGLSRTGSRRYLLEVSILITDSRRSMRPMPPTRDAPATIAEDFGFSARVPALKRRSAGLCGAALIHRRNGVLEH